MNQMLQSFLQKQAAEARLPDKPNKVKEEAAVSYESIIKDKPAPKKVLEYIKKRLNELYEGSNEMK